MARTARKRKQFFTEFHSYTPNPDNVPEYPHAEPQKTKHTDSRQPDQQLADHRQTDSQQATIGPEVPTDNVEINSNYSKVANALLENRERMSTLEYAVFLHLFRFSWGYGRNHLRVALDKLKDMCVVSRDSIQRALAALEKRGLIIRYERNYKKGNWYVVRLPANCSSACRLSASRPAGSGKPTSGKQPADHQQAFKKKDNLKEHSKEKPPYSPPRGGTRKQNSKAETAEDIDTKWGFKKSADG